MTSNIVLATDGSEIRLSSLGAQIDHWAVDGKTIIYLAHSAEGKRRGGCPICFPFFGPSPAGMRNHGKHGWFRQSNFRLWEMKSTLSGIEVVFKSTLAASVQYPWILECEIKYVFFNKTLRMHLKVNRIPDGIVSKAPINPAFHPYFSNAVVSIGRYLPDFSDKAHSEPLENFGDDQIIIETLEGLRVLMEQEGFGESYFWSGNPEEYQCVELVAQHHSKFNTSEGIYLSEGGMAEFSMTLTVL